MGVDSHKTGPNNIKIWLLGYGTVRNKIRVLKGRRLAEAVLGFDHEVGDAEGIVSRRIDGTIHGELPPGPPLLGKIPAIIHLPSGFPIDEDRAQGIRSENTGRKAMPFIGEEKNGIARS